MMHQQVYNQQKNGLGSLTLCFSDQKNCNRSQVVRILALEPEPFLQSQQFQIELPPHPGVGGGVADLGGGKFGPGPVACLG